MKKILSVFICLTIGLICYGQVPQAFSYQAVAIGDDGSVLTNQDINVKININTGSANGITAYSETHPLTTSDVGLFSVEVGNGTPLNGLFSDIDWSTGAYFLSVEVDETGTGFYQNIGVSQLLSVPFALYAMGGPAGPAGPEGPIGPVGSTGPAGLQGPPGASGPSGASGPVGPAGPPGDPGFDGANGGGTSCWDLNNNLENDPEEDINDDGVFSAHDCIGPQGMKGPKGPTGPPGNPNFVQGPSGEAGFNGFVGDEGAQGPKGPTIECSSWESIGANISYTGLVGVGINMPSCALDVGGTISAYGVNLSSDIRYKKDITPIEGTLDKVMDLEGVSYLFKKDVFVEKDFSDQIQVGLIAQEVEKVFPELVYTKADGYKAVNYSKLSPILLEALKTLNEQKEGKNAAWSQKIQNIDAELDELKASLTKTQ